MALESGTILGAFEIAGLLGRGGIGEVFRARDSKLGRDVALKVLPESFAGNSDRLARFEREAMILASLNHVNIGALHDFREEDGVYFLVLELVEGWDVFLWNDTANDLAFKCKFGAGFTGFQR